MVARTTAAPDYVGLDEVTLPEVMHALADPVRLGLVRLLSDGAERAWGELDVPIAPSTLSYHLKILRSSGITRTRKEGRRCFVHLRRDDLEEAFPGLIAATLGLMDRYPTDVVTVGIRSEVLG